MAETLTETRIALPLVATPAAEQAAPTWHGWTPSRRCPGRPPTPPSRSTRRALTATPAGRAVGLPPPVSPSARRTLRTPSSSRAGRRTGRRLRRLPLRRRRRLPRPEEVLRPRRGENFTLEELDEITAYAHSLQPRRRVFVTVNTLIRQDELAS